MSVTRRDQGERPVLLGLRLLAFGCAMFILAGLISARSDTMPQLSGQATFPGGTVACTSASVRLPGGSVTAEVADTDMERAQGLMGRQDIAWGHGMIFLFPERREVHFWMKDTPVSLDMIFIDGGRVVGIHRGSVPFSEDDIPSHHPVTSVLELVAGDPAGAGIAVGDTLAMRCLD